MNPATSPWPLPEPGTRWLLRLPNWIGDAVMVLPALRSLPREEQRWLGIAHERVLPVYARTGLFDELLPASGASAPLRLRQAVVRFHPHRAVVFTEAVSGALVARFSEAPQRIGWDGPLRGSLFTATVPAIDRGVPLWRSYRDLAEQAGGALHRTPDFTLDPGPEAAAAAAALLPGDEPTVALAPGSTYGPAKRWPVASFGRLAELLRDRGYRVVTVGSPAETGAARRLTANGALDLTGRTTLLEAIALLARCRAAVTNDSGALHLARTAGLPVVGIFGSSSPAWTGPTESEGVALWLGLDCSPCFARRCPLNGADRRRCLNDIEPGQVLAALEPMLEPRA